jgi:ADP-ribose pyrophosphatase YjhB (NUDIX family)
MPGPPGGGALTKGRRMAGGTKFAPREVFEQILEYVPIATFDLVVEVGGRGVVLVRRKIAPYRGVWALPGLRMHKGEGIDDTLRRIARVELGLEVDPSGKVLLGQYVGRFRTERSRQDISTGYLVRVAESVEIVANPAHFHGYRVTREVPGNTGAMYRYYLDEYFKTRA